MTEINHAIGAEGIVSSECKEVVTQYGDMIWELLVSGVGSPAMPFKVCVVYYYDIVFHLVFLD